MSPFDFYLHHEYALAASQLSLLMLGTGAALTAQDLGAVLRQPRGLVAGMALQLLLLPLLTWAFIQFGARDAGVAVGLALCAAIPSAAIANVFTGLARGHLALTVLLVIGATLACLPAVPLLLRVLVGDLLPIGGQLPLPRIAAEIGLFLLLPLLLGLALRRRLGPGAAVYSRICVRAGLLLLVLIVIGASGAGRLDTQAYGHYNLMLVLAYALAVALLSVLLPWLLRLPAGEVAAINLSATVRNTNLGLLIKASLFPAAAGSADPVGDFALFTILLYGGLSLLLGPALVVLHRRAWRPAAAAAAGTGLEAR